MSNQPFSFPPPPPPPPKQATDSFAQTSQFRGRGRGNAGGSGQFRGRGGGSNGVSYSRGGVGNRAGYQRSSFRGSGSNSVQKRSHYTAFQTTNQNQPRSQAPPAVPSFNDAIPHLLPPKPSPIPKPVGKSGNLLGLTPAKYDVSESEDDVDEEDKLAPPEVLGHQFEHRGQTLNLKSAADIAAWIAERRRRYPTQARAAVAKKEQEEKQKKRDEERKEKLEAAQQAREKWKREKNEKRIAEQGTGRGKQKTEDTQKKDSGSDPAAKIKERAEKLRRKALRAQQQLEKAEKALEKANAIATKPVLATPVLDHDTDPAATSSSTEQAELMKLVELAAAENQGEKGPDQHDSDAELLETSSESEPNDDETSSSGSDAESDSDSHSDSDSAPEQLSSKAPVSDHSINRPPPTTRPYQNLTRAGRCKFGKNCRFSHDVARPTAKTRAGISRAATQRKGLYQVMVEKEQEAAEKQILQSIVMLGDKGLLQPSDN